MEPGWLLAADFGVSESLVHTLTIRLGAVGEMHLVDFFYHGL